MDDMFSLLPAGGLSGEALAALSGRLWPLLAKRTARYTMGDSSSVPLETAEQLLSSICYTLGVFLRETGASPALLLDADLDELLVRGQQLLENSIKSGRLLWKAACLGAPKIANTYLQITLKSIGGFFDRYDFRFFAHQMPCDIVYQLCHPVPEDRLGIDYILEYLRRVLAENRILSRFDLGAVRPLLERSQPGYDDLPISLCEPVMINGIGLALIGGNVSALDITDSNRAAIADLLGPLPEPEARAILSAAASGFCRTVGIGDRFTSNYVSKTAAGLYPRLAAALRRGNLEGIFISPVLP